MVTNKLKLNGSKIELGVLASSHVSMYTSDLQLKIDKNLICPSASAKHFGAYLDQHVANISKASQFPIRNISYLRQILSSDALTSVVHAFITPQLVF